MHTLQRALLAAGLALMLAAPTMAQEPGATPPPPEPKPDRWTAALDLGFNGSTGNTRLAVLNTGFRVKHLQTESFELEWSVSYRYGESKGDVVARNAATSLTFDLTPRSYLSPFVYATVERDPFRKLDLRTNTGSGVKYTMYRSKQGTASLSAAALYSHEAFTIDRPTRRDARWSFRTKVEHALGKTMRVENTAFYKPVWDRSGDYNVQISSRMSTKVASRLAMTLSHEFLHDSTPPTGVGREDQRFQAGITLAFF